MSELSEEIRAIRKRMGLTQQELADKVGVSLSAIQGYEQGRYIPKQEPLKRINAVLKMEKQPMNRITIRDIIDLLDYDRTGIRTVRIVDDDTKQTDMLHTNSHLLEFIEDIPVNTLDTANGVITLYCTFKEADDGET